MDLTEKFFELWTTENLEDTLSIIQSEVEKITGPLHDAKHIEKLFIEQEKNGNIWGIETIQQYLNLHYVLKTVHAPEHLLLEFLEVFYVWYHMWLTDGKEEQLSEEQIKRLDDWIKKINAVEKRKYLFFLIKEGNHWAVKKINNMQDYENGTVSYMDIKVRKTLIDYIDEEVRLVLLAGDEHEEYCVEI